MVRVVGTYLLISMLVLSMVASTVFLSSCGRRPVQRYVKGEALVRFNKDIGGTEAERLLNSVGATIKDYLKNLNVYVISFSPSVSVEAMVGRLNAMPEVEHAEPNYLYEAIGESLAFAQDILTRPSGAKTVTVAVIDTGIDFNHPFFEGKIYTNKGEISGDGIDNDRNGYVDDVHGYDFYGSDSDPTGSTGIGGHGTSVAGKVLEGAGDIYAADIMPLRVGPGPGLSLSAIIKAIDYAVDNGAKVINMSFGGWGDSQFLQEALDRAHQNGVVLVAAAGNASTSSPFYPAVYDNVIAVGSTDANGKRSWFSNYGNYIDLVAEGQGVKVPSFGGGWHNWSGTSFAAPFVAGLAALLLSFFPELTPIQVEEVLKARALNIDGINGAYGGMLGAGFLGAAQLNNLIQELVHSQTTPEQKPITAQKPTDLSDKTDAKWLIKRTYKGLTYILNTDGSITVLEGEE